MEGARGGGGVVYIWSNDLQNYEHIYIFDISSDSYQPVLTRFCFEQMFLSLNLDCCCLGSCFNISFYFAFQIQVPMTVRTSQQQKSLVSLLMVCSEFSKAET